MINIIAGSLNMSKINIVDTLHFYYNNSVKYSKELSLYYFKLKLLIIINVDFFNTFRINCNILLR